MKNLSAETLLTTNKLTIIDRKKVNDYYWFNCQIKDINYLNNNVIFASDLKIINAVYLYCLDLDKKTLVKQLSNFSPIVRLPKRVIFPEFQTNQFGKVWEVKIGKLTEVKLKLLLDKLQSIDADIDANINYNYQKQLEYWDYVESCVDAYIHDDYDRYR